jgi:RNA polymerase sigma factor (sigma-70 family)
VNTPPPTEVGVLVGDLFRREFARLVAALVRLLGPAQLAMAEDVVHDALMRAMIAWRVAPPDDPRAWILQVARRRAIDLLRRGGRFTADVDAAALESSVDLVLSPAADAENQLAMMFAICDDASTPETHVTLILRLLCGFSVAEIARAFLVDIGTIDRRLHRGRTRLQQRGMLDDVRSAADVRARQSSVEHALYLLFNEGYHGSDAESPVHPAMCADAIHLAELLLQADGVERGGVHALAALFCFDAARLATRVDEGGAMVPLVDQDRSAWDRTLFERGVVHLGRSAVGTTFTRWHLEAGIAFEHVAATSVATTSWVKIVGYYDALQTLVPGPIVALNRSVALAELAGVDAGREALLGLGDDPKLVRYSFYWAARADLERRAGRHTEALVSYRRAVACAASRAERLSYERRIASLAD